MEFFGLKFHLPQKFVFEITPCGKKVSSAPEFVILDKILFRNKSVVSKMVCNTEKISKQILCGSIRFIEMKKYMITTTLFELVEKLSRGIKKQIELGTYVQSLQILVA